MKRFQSYSAILFLIIVFPVLAENTNSPETIPDHRQAFEPNPKMELKLWPLQETIQIDGNIDDAWNEAIEFDNFAEYQPSENRAPGAATHGYVAYDQNSLYIAFVCDDPNMSQLRATVADRDHIYNDDWVCVSIDPYRDNQKAYQFFANARGIQGDRLWQINTLDEDNSYDLVWDCAARIEDDCWTVEMRIPFENLRFPDQDNQSWSVHFTRNYPRDNPYRFSWMPISQNNNSFMGQAGSLSFHLPKRDSAKRTFEVLPYTIATQQRNRIEDMASTNFNRWHGDNPEARAGIGIKYGLSSNLIADVTYNPDFSQIESDAGQITVNNPFALFYDERRPFFQEGSDIYRLDQASPGIAVDQFVNLFYSRSINNPLIAAKLSGKIGKVAVGYTSAIDQNTPFIVPFEGQSAVLATDKRSLSNVIRAKYDLGTESTLGVFLSNRHLEDGSNTVTAVDATFRLSEQLMLTTIAGLSQTREPNDPELSQFIPDETFKAMGKTKTTTFDGEFVTGYILRAKLQRNARHFTGALCLQDFSPGFRADNGFISTTAYRNAEGTSAYIFRWDDHPIFTSILSRISAWRKANYDGVIIDTGIRPNITFQFRKQITVLLSTFLYNRENLYGKQFGDARSSWIYIANNLSKSFYWETYLRAGKEINRLGQQGSSYNPFEIVPTLSFTFHFTLKPVPKINYDVQYQSYNLYRKFWSGRIRSQNILRNAFSYQFNRRMFLRLIGEYNIVQVANAETGITHKQKFFSLEPLFSYKLNAFSVFYLGGIFGGKNAYSLDWDSVRFNRQTMYVKLQYLIGL